MNVPAFNIAISKSAEIPREGIPFKSYRQRSETYESEGGTVKTKHFPGNCQESRRYMRHTRKNLISDSAAFGTN